MREPTRAEMKRWAHQWQEAGEALENQKCQELASLTESRALEMSEAVLELSEGAYISPHRQESSGLVEQQAILHKLRKP